MSVTCLEMELLATTGACASAFLKYQSDLLLVVRVCELLLLEDVFLFLLQQEGSIEQCYVYIYVDLFDCLCYVVLFRILLFLACLSG